MGWVHLKVLGCEQREGSEDLFHASSFADRGSILLAPVFHLALLGYGLPLA